MPSPNRPLLKAAQSVHRQLTGSLGGPAIPTLPDELWTNALNSARSIAKARRCGWQQAARLKCDEPRRSPDASN